MVENNALYNLQSTQEVPSPYNTIFAKYVYFNVIQSQVYPNIFNSDENLVVSAPTGSGKTIIFELAIVKLLHKLKKEASEFPYIEFPYKIIYVAPMKALCEERLQDWHSKFTRYDINCISVTGDSDNNDCELNNLMMHSIIITTPEKWDSITRNWRENNKFTKLIKLFMIDEVHLLNDESRGPTLEAIICRMKMIQDYCLNDIRFIALSATIPNIEDIADWIGTPKKPAVCFRFGEELRPVKLNKIVLGYPYNPKISSPFKFDIMLSYKLQNIILQYSDGKPTLIFCSTRKSTEMTAKQVTRQLTINLTPEKKEIILDAVSQINDSNINATLIHGVGTHHAGIALENRKILEDLFRKGHLPVLVTTSTLAMGINLPAHLVIIKCTKYYAKCEYRDYSESTILQMIGRAGRPQFDASATAVIMTTNFDKYKYENMVGGTQPVESSLHKNLIEHLNAEVVLHTITDLSDAMQWLSSTFLHIRARKNPKYYGFSTGLNLDQLHNKLLELCQIDINKLAKEGMLILEENTSIKSTKKGFLMAKYYLHFETMKLFNNITGNEILQQILSIISKCHEFSELYLRVNDKKCLNLLNQCRNKETIRFQLNGKIKSLDMKINCLIQAVFGSLQISEPSLITEAQKIMRIGERITNCLIEFLAQKPKCFSAILSTIILGKCFHANLWENSTYVAKQLPKIGTVLSKNLSDAGKKNFTDILNANPRDIERILNKKAPFGNDIQAQIKHLPNYKVTLELTENNNKKIVNLHIKLLNSDDLKEKLTVDKNSYMNLIVGDDENNVLVYEKYKHSYLKDNVDMTQTMEVNDSKIAEIKAYFISEDWVGIDSWDTLKLKGNVEKHKEIIHFEQNLKKKETYDNNILMSKCERKPKEPCHIKKFMDMYFKQVKTNPKPKKTNQKKTIQRTITQVFDENKPEKQNKKIENKVDSYLTETLKHIENDVNKRSNQTHINLNNNRNEASTTNITNQTTNNSSISNNANQPKNNLTTSNNTDFSEFKFETPAKLCHDKSIQRGNVTDESNLNADSTTEKASYEITEILEPNQQSNPQQKTIKWNSPIASYISLTLNSSVTDESVTKSTNTSIEETNQLKETKVNKTINNSIKTGRSLNRMDSDDFKKYFPITDDDCEKNSAKIFSKPNFDKKINDLLDVVSPFFLEQIGFSNTDLSGQNKENDASSQKIFTKKCLNTPTDYLSFLEPIIKRPKLTSKISSQNKPLIDKKINSVPYKNVNNEPSYNVNSSDNNLPVLNSTQIYSKEFDNCNQNCSNNHPYEVRKSKSQNENLHISNLNTSNINVGDNRERHLVEPKTALTRYDVLDFDPERFNSNIKNAQIIFDKNMNRFNNPTMAINFDTNKSFLNMSRMNENDTELNLNSSIRASTNATRSSKFESSMNYNLEMPNKILQPLNNSRNDANLFKLDEQLYRRHTPEISNVSQDRRTYNTRNDNFMPCNFDLHTSNDICNMPTFAIKTGLNQNHRDRSELFHSATKIDETRQISQSIFEDDTEELDLPFEELDDWGDKFQFNEFKTNYRPTQDNLTYFRQNDRYLNVRDNSSYSSGFYSNNANEQMQISFSNNTNKFKKPFITPLDLPFTMTSSNSSIMERNIFNNANINRSNNSNSRHLSETLVPQPDYFHYDPVELLQHRNGNLYFQEKPVKYPVFSLWNQNNELFNQNIPQHLKIDDLQMPKRYSYNTAPNDNQNMNRNPYYLNDYVRNVEKPTNDYRFNVFDSQEIGCNNPHDQRFVYHQSLPETNNVRNFDNRENSDSRLLTQLNEIQRLNDSIKYFRKSNLNSQNNSFPFNRNDEMGRGSDKRF